MRHHPVWLFLPALCLGATLSLAHAQDKDKDKDPKKDADAAKVLEEQRKALKANWDLVNAGEMATVYRALPKDKLTDADRKKAATAAQVKKRAPKDVWGGALDADEAMPLYGSLADFFAYGPAG